MPAIYLRTETDDMGAFTKKKKKIQFMNPFAYQTNMFSNFLLCSTKKIQLAFLLFMIFVT